jgi:methionyl-tRNA formyltransferase
MRILFIGTGTIGVPTLRSLLANPSHVVCAVICQPDKPAGRKQEMTAPPTKMLALEHGIPVYQPRQIRSAAELVARLQPDVAVVMAYGQILPRSVLEAPRYGCLNLHASLLPRHRGAAPVQAAILAGDAVSGITVIHMDEGLDTGDVLLREELTLSADETGGSLHDRLAELAPAALGRALELLASDNAPRAPQNADAVSYAPKLSRADGIIPWDSPAETIARKVRAYHPWPGTATTLPDGTLVKVFPPVEALADAGGGAAPGTILTSDKNVIVVACGAGKLRVHKVQPEGRKRMDAAAFLAGHRLHPGDRLGSTVN